MPTFEKFSTLTATGSFYNNSNVLTDPAAPLFGYQDATGVWTLGLVPTKVSTGVYTYELDTSAPDVHTLQESWIARFYTTPTDALLPGCSLQVQFQIRNEGAL